MKLTTLSLTSLRKPEKNLRLHTDKQLKEFERSINMFGQIRPIVVDEHYTMLAGNGLYEALLRAGYTEADCYVVEGLTERQKKKLMMADNRIFDLGVDDMSAFDAFLVDLGEDLDVPGFDEDLLQSLVADTVSTTNMISSYGLVPEDRAAEIRETHERYEKRDAAAAEDAIEYRPAPPPAQLTPQPQDDPVQEVRDATGYAAPFKAEEAERRFIRCPRCGELIWL